MKYESRTDGLKTKFKGTGYSDQDISRIINSTQAAIYAASRHVDTEYTDLELMQIAAGMLPPPEGYGEREMDS